MNVISLSNQTLVTAGFILIPIILFISHIFLSLSGKIKYGVIVPAIWLLLSGFIIFNVNTYYVEMIIFCLGIELILLLMFYLCRFLKQKIRFR